VEGVLRLLGSLILALQDQTLPADPSDAAVSIDILTLVTDAGPVVQAVLVALLLFSAASWGIIVFKKLQLRRADAATRAFLAVFRKSSRFSEVQAASAHLGASPLVGLFQAGYAELTAQLRAPGDDRPAGGASRPTLRSLDAVDRALLRASTVEVNKLEQRVPFLATTASITPYIGLFGTVWGIMNSFIGIVASQSTSLVAVAPGIAGALLATATALLAAIPAVLIYNFTAKAISKQAGKYEDFAAEFMALISRDMDRRGA
jgi:biopolymer transport protein TolQ